MKKKKYKVSPLWWVGWIITFPLRLIVCFILALILASHPKLFYPVWEVEEENDQSKWRL